MSGPVGVFDSGYGGLTVLEALRRRLPGLDYLYLGDNARAPYGSRSFETVYRFTLQAVEYLFSRGCPLVILACNTASAKALRTIQQNDLPRMADPTRRVLGVIRPTVEALGGRTRTGHVGVLGTPGTVASRSYDLEMAHLWPTYTCHGHACTLWAALVEAGEARGEGTDYFVHRDLQEAMKEDPAIDTLVLACTHYPLLLDKIRQYAPAGVSLLVQGDIVAASLDDYLNRHPEMASRLTRGGTADFLTTDAPERFGSMATLFLGAPVQATHVEY